MAEGQWREGAVVMERSALCIMIRQLASRLARAGAESGSTRPRGTHSPGHASTMPMNLTPGNASVSNKYASNSVRAAIRPRTPAK